jgi:hypothetical protein
MMDSKKIWKIYREQAKKLTIHQLREEREEILAVIDLLVFCEDEGLSLKRTGTLMRILGKMSDDFKVHSKNFNEFSEGVNLKLIIMLYKRYEKILREEIERRKPKSDSDEPVVMI